MLERILHILGHWEVLAVIGFLFLIIPLIVYLSSTERKPPVKIKKKPMKPRSTAPDQQDEGGESAEQQQDQQE